MDYEYFDNVAIALKELKDTFNKIDYELDLIII